MYQVLLLEDEVEVLSAMLDVISWEELGFAQPKGAQNGREGIKILKSGFEPDVIITDIYMPFVDGLEVAAYAKEHHPDAIVVILTGHDDFQYAQKAVQLGVHDYILKPITPKKIQSLLEDLYIVLQEVKSQKKDVSKVMQTHFFNQLVSRKMDLSTIENVLRDNKITFPYQYNTVVVSDVDEPYPESIEERNQVELMRFALLNITKELAEEQEGIHVFLGNEGLVTLFVGGKDQETCHDNAKRFCNTVISIFYQSLQVSASYGIGRAVDSLTDLYSSHQQAMDALETRFYSGRKSITLYRQSEQEEQKKARVDSTEYQQSLEKAVYNFDYSAAQEVIREFLDELSGKKVSFGRSVSEAQKLLNTLVQSVRTLGKKADTSAMEEYWQVLNLNTVMSLHELEQSMLTLLDKSFIPLNQLGRNQTTIQMSQAEFFIRENYANPDLSLKEITDHLAVSVSYFSTNFKAHTDMTFVEYLTMTRMEHAKRIIRMSNMRTYEVAAEVGYANPHYFSSAFKKYTGNSPKEYRETYQEEGGE